MFQVYVTAPLAVNEATELAHTVPADCVTNTSGVGLETTVSKVLVEQPKPLVPVSVYVVVIVGDNAAVEEVAPLLQLYVLAPLPVSVVVWPEQMVMLPL